MSGMDPRRRFVERRIIVSCVILPISGGICPDSELYGKESMLSRVKFPSSGGSVPHSSFVDSALRGGGNAKARSQAGACGAMVGTRRTLKARGGTSRPGRGAHRPTTSFPAASQATPDHEQYDDPVSHPPLKPHWAYPVAMANVRKVLHCTTSSPGAHDCASGGTSPRAPATRHAKRAASMGAVLRLCITAACAILGGAPRENLRSAVAQSKSPQASE